MEKRDPFHTHAETISKIKKVVANAGLISEEKITISRVEAGVTNQVYFLMGGFQPKAYR